MKLRLSLMLLLLAVAVVSSPLAASAQDENITPEQIEELRNALNSAMNDGINTVVNGMMIFGAQRSVSSGVFSTNNIGEDYDEDLDVQKLNFEMPLAEEDSALIPFISGTLSSVKITSQIPPFIPETGENDFMTIKSDTAAIGGGVHYEVVENLTLTGEFGIAYSHVENNYDYHNMVSEYLIKPLIDKQTLNWHMDMLTYMPAFKALYEIPVGEDSAINLSARYSHMFNDSYDSSTSGKVNVESNTGLLQSRIEGVTPLFGYKICEDKLKTRAYFQRSDTFGDFRDNGGLDFFYETGLDFFADTKDSSELFSEVGLSLGYVYRDEFTGWRAGVLLSF
ncbi:MAG: Solitary outer membrane autotransporter beta-barrel domain [Deltaproteobacteria bacterium]|nr:Solitary outer membrane autotransporter beta-barrel domain [Deltaproteobacteria bacterium]